MASSPLHFPAAREDPINCKSKKRNKWLLILSAFFVQIRSRVWLVVLSFFFNRLIWRLRKGTTSVWEELEEDGGQIWVCGRLCVRASLEEVGGLI